MQTAVAHLSNPRRFNTCSGLTVTGEVLGFGFQCRSFLQTDTLGSASMSDFLFQSVLSAFSLACYCCRATCGRAPTSGRKEEVETSEEVNGLISLRSY